ncbi:MAG: hypothetical protein ABI577_19200 [bacterium]
MDDSLRLSDILTTASAVANFSGDHDVLARHLLVAIDLLQGRKTLDDLGRPLSPLVSRMTGAGSGASAEVRDLAQRWFARQGGNVLHQMSDAELAEFVSVVAYLASGTADHPGPEAANSV